MKLALIALFAALTACATTSTSATSSTAPARDWRRWNDPRPGSNTILSARSIAERGIVVPDDMVCHRTPPSPQPNMVTVLVRFTAPLSGAYSVSPLVVQDEDYRHARPVATSYLYNEEAGNVVSCYFALPDHLAVNAVRVTRWQLWCPEPPTATRSCPYQGYPVGVSPVVQRDGQILPNGRVNSFFDAYLTTLQPPNP